MMNYQFSDRMSALQPSVIREIFKFTADPSVISFAAGNPSPDSFPAEDVARIAQEILTQSPVTALQYSLTEGYPALRDRCKQLLEEHYQIPVAGNELIIISGAQQGADLATKALVNEGDTVICEDPSFIGCLNCFRSYNCNLVGVEMESDGLNTAKLEQAIIKNPNVKLLYLIPNFQNPTGITTSLAKRQEILRIAKEHDIMILEDNPYGDLRYSGEPVPSIKSMDTEGRVIYVGSFSKILSPGMRIGYVLADPQVITKMTVGKQCADVHTNILSQMICERWLTTCDLKGHIAKNSKLYHHKKELMCSEIDRNFASAVTRTDPDGGLFLWCTLPKGADMLAFCREAVQNKVAVVPGSAFLARESDPCLSFRLNFSTPSDEAIVKGIGILGELTKKLFN